METGERASWIFRHSLTPLDCALSLATGSVGVHEVLLGQRR